LINWTSSNSTDETSASSSRHGFARASRLLEDPGEAALGEQMLVSQDIFGKQDLGQLGRASQSLLTTIESG